jgi:hypothetical protein
MKMKRKDLLESHAKKTGKQAFAESILKPPAPASTARTGQTVMESRAKPKTDKKAFAESVLN